MFDFTRISPFEIEWAEHNKGKQVNRGGVREVDLFSPTALYLPLDPQKIDEYVNDRAN